MIQPTSEGASIDQKIDNRDQGRDKNAYDKKHWKRKNDSSVTRKVTQRPIFQKAIIRMSRKKSIKEAITTSPEPVYPVNQASLTSAR